MVEVRRRPRQGSKGKTVPRKTSKKAEQRIKSWANMIKEQRLRVVNWRAFDTIIFVQGALGLIHIIAGIAAGAVGQLSPWAFFSTAILLFITVIPTVHQMITEDETDAVVLFGWLQIVSAVCCLFFVTLNLLDFSCNNLEWRAYFTLSVVFWQFVSVIIISLLPSEKASLSEFYMSMLRRNKQREIIYKTSRRFPHKKCSDISIVVEHRNKPKEEPSDSYLRKLTTYLEKELLKKREQKKRRLERIATEMKTKWNANKHRSQPVISANSLNSTAKSRKRKTSTESEEAKHSETSERVSQRKMSSNMPKSDVVKTEANKRLDSEGKENNKLSDQPTQTSGSKDSVLTSKP